MITFKEIRQQPSALWRIPAVLLFILFSDLFYKLSKWCDKIIDWISGQDDFDGNVFEDKDPLK